MYRFTFFLENLVFSKLYNLFNAIIIFEICLNYFFNNNVTFFCLNKTNLKSFYKENNLH